MAKPSVPPIRMFPLNSRNGAKESAAQELTVEVGGKESVKGPHEQAKIEDYS